MFVTNLHRSDHRTLQRAGFR